MLATQASDTSMVDVLCLACLGRPADDAERQNVTAALAGSSVPTSLAEFGDAGKRRIIAHALAKVLGDHADVARHPALAQQFVAAVFRNLFNHAPSLSDLETWSNAITMGGMSPAEAAMQIALAAGVADSLTMKRKVMVDSIFSLERRGPVV